MTSWGALADGYLSRYRVTAHAFAGPGYHSRGVAPVIFIGFLISYRHSTPADCSLVYHCKVLIDTGTSGR